VFQGYVIVNRNLYVRAGAGMTVKWGEITVNEIVSAIGGRQISGSSERLIKGLSTDSRKMVPGHIFLALKGERYDGHDFLDEAVHAGAACLIIESAKPIQRGLYENNLVVVTVPSTLDALGDLALWWRKQWGGKIIAITGSNGKTTTKEMAASILSLKARTMKSPGNFNNLIGLPLSILLIGEEYEFAVLEMGMNRSGEIARLTRIAEPQIGVITNIASAHLEGLGDLEGVAAAKGELLREMSSESTAILNGDSEITKRCASEFQGPIITFGLNPSNRIRAEHIRGSKDSSQAFTLTIDNDRFPVRINLLGTHNVLNALAGAAIAFSLSLPRDLIAQGLEECKPLKGRFQVIEVNGAIRLIDDTYNSNPSSLKAGLETIKELKDKEHGLVVCLGEMLELGKEAAKYHFNAGQLIAGMGTRHLVVMGEHGHHVIEGAREAGMPMRQTSLATTHTEMLEAIKANVREGDIVFLKGSRKVALDKVVEGIKRYFHVPEGEKNAL
jgi:UDP-N-acetylmuramoyl-tripeptide--D-alanyl-D-alanine ligase